MSDRVKVEASSLPVGLRQIIALLLGLGFFLCLCPPTANAVLVPRDRLKERAVADALFTNGVILNLKIQIPETNVAQLRKEAHKYVTGTLQEGDAVFKDIAIHLKGSYGSFRQIDDKPGFTISFSTYESGTNFHGLQKFHLNNSVQDPTYLSDWLCAELFRRAGVPAPMYAHALVELNGRKLGLYVIMESEDRDYLSRYFKNTKGNLYGQSGNAEIWDPLERMEGKGPLDRAELKALVTATQEPDPNKRWQRLQQTLDVNRFVSYMAMEVILCDWDGYVNARHNYRIYQDLDNGGRMVMMPHDKDQMIGDMNLPFIPHSSGAVLCTAILGLPQTRLQYRNRFGELLTNVFKPAVLTNEIDKLVAKLLPALTNYNKDFARDFVNNANGLRERIVNRKRGLDEQLSVPGPQMVQFTNDVAGFGDWEAIRVEGNMRMEATKAGNKLLLHSQCEGGPAMGVWRASVLLGPGKYRFSGLAKCANMEAHGSEYGIFGGGLRSTGSTRTNRMEKTMDWTPLAHDFSLDANGEVALGCELRAGRGEIWFDVDSLKLERVK